MNEQKLQDRLLAPGPKRVLGIDGGGLRGLISLGFLRELERILRERTGRPDLVLADYFDLIGGTSTGAIIATVLALGQPVAEIHRLYLQLGRDAFHRRRSMLGPLGRMLGPKFDERPFLALLRDYLEDRTLGSEDLRCGLVIVTKRADTSSVWPLVNLPTQKYYEANRHLLLRDVVAWSAAAPTYFRPQRASGVGGGKDAVFVDGGASMHNCPALLLLMVATLEGFGLQWPLGADQLLLCSVGTGGWEPHMSPEALAKAGNLSLLATLTVQMMHDAKELNQTLLTWMSRSATARKIDAQVGSLENDLLGAQALLTYLRYDVALEVEALTELGFEVDEAKVRRLREMADVRNMEYLDLVGRQAATKQVAADHLPPPFDP